MSATTPPAEEQPDITKQLLKQREALAFTLFSTDNNRFDHQAMAVWRTDGEIRKRYKIKASNLLSMLEALGVRTRVSSTRSLDAFLQELITIPAAPAYSIEEESVDTEDDADLPKNELPNGPVIS